MIPIYLLKSTLCLGILFGFYKIALENKAMHQFKRFYLLASLIFAFTIPLVTFTYETDAAFEQVLPPTFENSTEIVYVENTAPIVSQVDYVSIVLWSIYGIGILVFGARFIINLVRLKRKIDTAETFPEKDFTLALLGKTIVPHSFFKWIFLNKTEYLNKEIAPEVIAHEATHVRQKHSWDILIIEFLQVIFWFNPLIWLSKISIKLNHEFLADQGAIKDNSNIAIYQNILLSYASSSHHTALESPFNYSLTKKRIVMLSQSFSKKKVVLRALLLIPVVATCAVVFNQAIVAKDKLSPDIAILGEWIDQKTENPFITIFKKNDSLWANINNDIEPILNDNKGYYLQNKNINRDSDYYISVNQNGELRFGDYPRVLISASKSVMRSVQGEWQNKETNATYIFSLEGGFVCDIIEDGKKPVRYWPNLKDGGLTFTIGYDWVNFKRDGDNLLFTNRNNEVEILERSRVTARSISIKIIDINYFELGGVKIKKTDLFENLWKLHTDMTIQQRNDYINIHVNSEGEIPYNDLIFIQKIASSYGYYRIVTPYEEIIRAKGNEPMKPEKEMVPHQNYAQEFIAGAAQNGINAIVIEVKNDSIYVNGTYTTINNLRKTIDAATANWSKEEYADPMRSMIFKGNTDAFIQRAEKEFQKTALYKANPNLRLIPPPPPAPPSPGEIGSPPPPPPTSPEEHFVKMRKLGGLFFYEGEKISFDKAVSIVKMNNALNVRTPYPYSNPPETFLTNQQEDLLEPLPIKQQIKNNDNPKKFFVQLEENKIRINGNLVAMKDVAQEFDKYTRNWTTEDFQTDKRAQNTILANLQFQLILDYDFLQALKKEMRKTEYFKKTGELKIPPSSFPSGTISNFLIPKLSNNWDVYFENKKISIKATEEILNKKNWFRYKIFHSTDGKQPEIYFYNHKPMMTESQNKEATQEEIKFYNRLAKKYNANPTGKILQGEVILMYEFYTKMSAKQKKNAETYPILPPPPPPPPVKVIKGVNDGDKNNPPPPALKSGLKLATQKEVKTYNRLAKKYNANPTGKILQGEVILMYEFYTKMNAKQKKNAETYPILPPPPPPPPVKIIKGVNDGDKNNPAPPPPPKKKTGYSFNTNEQPQSTLSLFSNIEEHPEDYSITEIPSNLSFTPSSVQTVSQNIKSTEDRDKAMDSILATYSLSRENTEVTTTVVTKEEPPFDEYRLGGYSISTGLQKDYSQDYQVKTSSSFTVKENSYDITTTFTDDVSSLDHYTKKIKEHGLKNGTFELNGETISMKEALIAIEYPYIGLEEDYTTKPHNMVIKKDPITSTWDIIYNDKLLTETEYYKLSKNLNLKLKKIRDKTSENKAVYILQKT